MQGDRHKSQRGPGHGDGDHQQSLVAHVREVRPDLDEQEAFDWAYHVNATVHGYVLTELTGMSTAPHRVEELYEAGLSRVLGLLDGPPA